LEAVARETLDIPAPAGKTQSGGKRSDSAKNSGRIEQAGVWQMMQKNMPAEQYTYLGDPLKIDVAYRPNGVDQDAASAFS
jgi:hypothetical protein